MIEYFNCSVCDKLIPDAETYKVYNTKEIDEQGYYLSNHYCKKCFDKLTKPNLKVVNNEKVI